jgi:hypothetical protein
MAEDLPAKSSTPVVHVAGLCVFADQGHFPGCLPALRIAVLELGAASTGVSSARDRITDGELQRLTTLHTDQFVPQRGMTHCCLLN